MRKDIKLNPNSDFPANPHEKAGFDLEFCDDFEEQSLDLSKWLPYYLPQWSSRAATQTQYSFKDECLQLHINENQKPWSVEYNGDVRVSSLQTGCYSGPIGSSKGQHPFKEGLVVKEEQARTRLYTPTYGFFEVRMKAIALSGYLAALWMIGFEEQAQESSEICICEIKGEYVQAEESVIGYGVHPFKDPAIKDEFYEDKFNFNAADFHIYAVDWTPDHIDFYIDNQKIKTITQSPKYAMQFMLNIYELPDKLTAESRLAPFPKIMTVDYVRGYSKQKRNGSV